MDVFWEELSLEAKTAGMRYLQREICLQNAECS